MSMDYMEKYKKRLLAQNGTLSRINALETAVEKGKELTNYIEKSDPYNTTVLDSINNEKFNNWLSFSIATLEEHYEESSNIKRFKNIAEQSIHGDIDSYNKLLSSLEGILEFERQKVK